MEIKEKISFEFEFPFVNGSKASFVVPAASREEAVDLIREALQDMIDQLNVQ